jgi:hypothetical protein
MNRSILGARKGAKYPPAAATCVLYALGVSFNIMTRCPMLFRLLAARHSSPECARPGPALREVSSIDGVLRPKRLGRGMQEERERSLRSA